MNPQNPSILTIFSVFSFWNEFRHTGIKHSQMINLNVQILESPLDEFEEIRLIAEKIKENIGAIEPECVAEVSITLMANRHFNLKIESADAALKKRILS